MAEALIEGLISSGLAAPGQIIAHDRDEKRLFYIAERYKTKVNKEKYEVANAADIIIVAVKPDDVAGVLADIAPEVTREKLIISVVAGKTTGTLLELLMAGGLRHPVKIIRAMPNLPALVREGATGIFAGSGAGMEEIKTANAIFGAVGAVVNVNDEALMDAVTGLSGSGPAYVFLFMSALIEAGVKEGLPREDAKRLVAQTVLGAAKTAIESGKDVEELIKMVASPGGTTIEGLRVFEEAGLKKIVKEAVGSATRKARELAGRG
ncbi:MAG: pyrroline-5-carboxylate reductase [Deltaproteobacteria bacterium]|nr:pyrroline-5-carboxylate reductase [Deltaproteobacteria bacterium]